MVETGIALTVGSEEGQHVAGLAGSNLGWLMPLLCPGVAIPGVSAKGKNASKSALYGALYKYYAFGCLNILFCYVFGKRNVYMVKQIFKRKISNSQKECGKEVFLFPRIRFFVPPLEIFYAYIHSKVNIYMYVCIYTHSYFPLV